MRDALGEEHEESDAKKINPKGYVEASEIR
jgi:hypothetical protein